MERDNGGVSSEGVLIPVPDSSELFEKTILAPLQGAYLYEESRQFFKYKSAVLLKNSALEEKYNAFREKRKQAGYSEEDLKETYGFLLFDDVNKAIALGKTGVLTGNSTCTTLGDPSKGVYISMHSDCLDSNCWYHGKSGYIAIIRLTKGKVNKVVEIYTQNFTTPTEGFDCHVSEQLPSVSSETSSFLAFERTQYYIYERLNEGSNETAQSPSAACPFAIVSFSYTDSKATPVVPQEKSEVKKIACPYLPWRGKLQIGTQFYSVGLKSTAGASMPSKLPHVVKINRAISMVDLRHLLPRAVFETCITGEAFLDGLYCSLCELISTEVEENSSLALLVGEIKKKDAALTFPLNDGGFLILLHSSHFLGYDDTGCSSSEGLQGIFVFPDSRVAVRDVKLAHGPSAIAPEKLWFLPALRSAEGKVGEPAINSSEQLWDRLVQYIQSYEGRLNPGMESSPPSEASISPGQCGEQDSSKHLNSPPEWSDGAWQSLKSYLSKPASFQLPLSKASEVLAAEQEEQREDLDDDVYICVSSPEMGSPVSNELENQVSDKTCVDTLMDNLVSKAEAQSDSPPVPGNVLDLQAAYAAKDNTQCATHTELRTTDDAEEGNQLIPLSDDLPSELIVSITSAEQSVSVDSKGVDRNMATTKHDDFNFGGISMNVKLQSLQTNSHSDEPHEAIKVVGRPEVINLANTKKKKKRRGRPKKQTPVSTACVRTPSSQTGNTPDEIDNLNNHQDKTAEEVCVNPQQNVASNAAQRVVIRRKRVAAGEKVSDPKQQGLENSILMELKAGPLRKKTDLWDLKPVVSECGRILVPHGSLDIAYHIKDIREKIQATRAELDLDKPLSDPSAEAQDTVEMEQEAGTDPETSVDEMGITKSMDCANHQQNTNSHINPEENILGHSDRCSVSVDTNINGELLTKEAASLQEKQMDSISTGRSSEKGEMLLSKLKSVLLRGKKKIDFFMTEEATKNNVQDIDISPKKPRVGSEPEMTGNSGRTLAENTSVDTISNMLPIDVFAFALGLTPKETAVKRTGEQENLQNEDSPETNEKTSSDKQHQILRRPLSIYPQRRRIKTLKKLQGISEECMKEKWWLHFQSPACNASENLAIKDGSRDNLVRKTVKENVNSVCASADGLNLLADLALGADSSQVPPQPHPALERQPETSLKECDLTKNITSVDHESILHALLRQPSVRAIHQPHASTSLNRLEGDSELVDLLMKEHAYSLASSSSLLLGLPGTPFQASPVSGSTRLLLHHQTVYGDKYKTLHSSVGDEDQCEVTKIPECLKNLLTTRQKFRHSRTFDHKDGSLQVTRHWPEKYNFGPDSKFTSERITKAIIRALHGPWDLSIHDSEIELQLISHVWIGLFYSRSTARSFQDDSNFTYPCPDDFVDVPSAVNSDPAKDDLKASSFEDASDPSTPEVLDLSKKCNSALDQDSVILDLSLKNTISETATSESQVTKKETSESNEQEEVTQERNELKSPEELNESQQEFGQSTEENIEATDVNDKSADGEKENNGFYNTMIPFIGPDISGTTEPQDSLLKSNDEDVVQYQEEIPFINETTNSEAILHTAAHGTSEICVQNEEPSFPKVPLHDATETYQPKDGGSQPDNRCPTPTIDEKPYEYTPLGSKNADEILKNICETSSSSSNSEIPGEKDLCDTPAVNTHESCHSGLHADLESSALKVLQSMKDFLSKSDLTDKPCQDKLTDINESSIQAFDSRGSHVHSVTSLEDSNMRKEEKPTVACATQDSYKESSDPDPSFQNKMEEILCVKLQVKKMDSSEPQLSPITNDKLETSGTTDLSNSDTSVPLAEWSQVNKSVNPEIKQTNSQCNSKHEPCSRSQHPVKAVKPSKSEESLDYLPDDPHKEKSTQNILTSTPVATYTNLTPVLLDKTEKDHLKGNSKNLKENHSANGLPSTDTWMANGHYKYNSEKTHLAPLDSYQGDDHPNNRIAFSFLSISSIESAKSSPKHFDEDQHYLGCGHSDEDLKRRTKETSNIKQAESAPIVTHKDDGKIDDSLILSPSTSLVCTILNTKETAADSFLEQLSKRCLQVDPTQASVEQACLIFSEKMKQLVKKSQRGPTQREDAPDNLRSSCSTPVTVRFSDLDEQDTPLYLLGKPLNGLTIMADMSDRKTQQVQNTRHRREKSHTASNPLEHAGVSHLTAQCARLYKEAMHSICAVEMDLPRPKRFKMDGVHSKTGPSKYFDFCDRMKREMDEKFRSKLNSLVKKSCKTRYRFFILLTSDDIFFDETKAQLEAEGHTAVDPALFFKDTLSSLLIVLRNEDIAKHIFQVPHLLELKRSPNVLFAGIDEPDDVINLTHQEVFTAGGIVMIDKEVLESLNLCNMKKVSAILQELNGTGKWKWMLHYRDSRRIKENARLSAEAKEKKNFLLWGQDAGILEVMPYHECDLMSREQPDYLACLIRLQIQNISARHTVFITDNATDDAYERKGILTTTMNTFLTKSPRETFTGLI